MPPFRHFSITWRVRILNGLLSALSLVLLIILAQARIHAVLYGAVDRTLTTQAIEITKRPNGEGRPFPDGAGGPPVVGFPGEEYPRPPGPEQRPEFRRPEPRPVRYGAISMMPTRHMPMDGQSGPEPWSVAGREAARSRKIDVRTRLGPDGERVRVVSYRHDDGPGPGEIIQAAALLEPTDAALQEIDTALYILLAPLALAAAVLGAFLTEMALSPVRQLARVISTIQPSNLSARLPEPGGNDSFDRLAQLLNALLGRMEEAFARQKRFTGSASHELRTPIAVIKSATSLLLESPESLTPLQQRVLDRADQSADRANRLISDLLTLARTENNTLPIRLTDVRIAPLIRETIAESGFALPSSAVPIVINIPDGPTIRTDADLLRRLVINLVSNAVRHTHQGQVTVAATVQKGFLMLSVRDTGEGIAQEDLARLGEPFYRPDNARAREQGGTGLGLSICKGIVSTLGGTMTIESIIGQGTTVSATIPQRSGAIEDR